MKFFITIYLHLMLTLFFITKTKAQTPFQIQGAVINAQTQEPLSNVNISKVGKTESGTSTNLEGVFQIEISELPTTLQVSYVGYEMEFLEIKDAIVREFIIELRPTSTALPEVAVTDKRKVDTVFFKPYSVVDYAFVDDKILLLAHRNSIQKYTLIALDEKTHEPIAEFSLKEYSTKGLFQHCTGEVFLITEANVHEVAIDSTGIYFTRQIFLGDFFLIDHPCMLANENFIYFAKYFYQGQALRYHAYVRNLTPQQRNGEAPILTDSIEKYDFPLIQNEDNIVRLIEDMGLRLPWSGDLWDENINDRLLSLKDSDYGLKGIMKIFYPKINAPVFQVGEEVVMFNHQESTLEFFSEKGDSIRSIPIDYHQTRKWKKQIYFDEIEERAYTTFNTRWGERIQEIDLKTGKLKSNIPIDFAFIEKPKIRNGYIYFLFRDTWKGNRYRMLHKVEVR